MKKKAFVLCTGCPESRIDSARVQNFLRENGWRITNDPRQADLILFRACGLKEDSVQEDLQIIRRLKAEKKENTDLIVWGCLPKIDLEALRTEYNGVTFGEKEVDMLNKILEAAKPIQQVVANCVMPATHLDRPGFDGFLRKVGLWAENRFSIAQKESIFHIKVSTGCLGNCSFCAVRKSRGVVSSKSIGQVLSEFREGLEKGFRYFGLLATDLGAYGRDLGHDLADLLVEMTKEKGDYKIGLRNLNPYFLIEGFEKLRPIFSTGKTWFLSSAIESASDRILRLMHRKYGVQDFKKYIQILNREYPDILLRTQFMVGFPTETEEDFQKSLYLLDELEFDWVEVYKFSPRKGTAAARMTGQIPEKVKETRFRQLMLKAVMQRPRKKLRKILQLHGRSHCERQDWTP